MNTELPKLSTGLKRSVIVLSVAWIIGYYLTHKEAIGFSWTAAWSTPSTMCSDVYAKGDDRLTECEAAGPVSLSDRFLREQRGEKVEVPFDYYQRSHHIPPVWNWMFGVPLVLFVLAHAFVWVAAGFRADRRN
jgi:hypothetical protein